MTASSFNSAFCALLSALLVSVLLVGCTDPTAFRVEGPVEVHESGLVKQLNYTVYNFAPTDSCLTVLRSMAHSGIVDDGHTGTFKVIFTDAATKQTLLGQTVEVYPDLLFANEQPVVTNSFGIYR
ncbi:hypothetical protein MUN81_15470 [Hymenobacter sp. 5317J-9]|uniref:hypothetical protein n=1 Tax=Hymenobacter sp. 5317J-9 TaxID=2932250 RepID=UPI001FD6D8F2|nr:hypothetical protein [Hymenobacter sp. 5317J-9]UOQ96635.1 hypothetical protein MUN81_15470 [Hymenobacter sp. 5317J-9]